jgi:predicted nucleic-acid-binding protein
MNSYLCDTNFILRFLLKDVETQAKLVHSYFQKAKNGEIHLSIPHLVFVESDFALTEFYHFKKSTIIDILYSLVRLPYIDIEKKSILLAALHMYLQKNISLIDALFMSEAQETGKTLLTFDKKLKK